MKNYLLLLLLSIQLLISCKEINEKNEFYSNGLLKSTKTYISNDTLSYKEIVYDSLGKISLIQVFTNGNRDSTMLEYYSNGRIKNIFQYKNGIRNGINKHYANNGELIIENLIINDIEISKRLYSKNNFGILETLDFEKKEDSMIICGFLYKNANNTILKNKSYYYSIINRIDTLNINQKYNLTFKLFTSEKISKIIHIEIGDLNSDGKWFNKNLNSTLKWTNSEIDLQTITYSFSPKKKGYYMLTGEIQFIEYNKNKTDSTVYSLPVWEDFYVK